MDGLFFPTDHASIIEKIRDVNPTRYAATRNFSDGAVSHLSPYISRGVISLPLIKKIVLEKYEEKDCWKFFQELAWREYFQRVFQAKGVAIFSDLTYSNSTSIRCGLPTNILKANTGITSIDAGIKKLYDVGYMHNHWRLYTSSIFCNVANADWLLGAKWMYYYLLDADLASNFLSWQWVAGTFSSKRYIFNQENLNKYSGQDQTQTFLNQPYSEFPLKEIPTGLEESTSIELKTKLPETLFPLIDHSKPTLIYTAYNLDPYWRKEEEANRILLLSPTHFDRYPMGPNTIKFVIDLSKNIPGMQIYCGEIEDLQIDDRTKIIYKEYPLLNYDGVEDQREWLCKEVHGYFPSFSSYIKKVKKITSAA